MQLRNTTSRYGLLSMFFHWSIAFAVYAMFALGLWMVTLSYYDDWYHAAPEWHKSVGMVLFAVMILRTLWRFISPPPAPLNTPKRITRYTIVAVHILLYALLFAIFISGYLISTAEGKPIEVFGILTVPATFQGESQQADIAGNIHLWLAWSVIGLSLLHAFAAFRHHFILRDDTLNRMTGRTSTHH
ncbi:MAG: Cytochrome b561 [Candidatus Erwinia impunctatus]|nr:Cytochrome b561 [Culicoides impunctatus]